MTILPPYTEPLHVILDALDLLNKSIDDGNSPWENYESAFDIDGILAEASEGEYRRAIQIAGHYIRCMIEEDMPLEKAWRVTRSY